MKSIRTKFVILILISLMVCITAIGSAGIISTKNTIEAYSAQLINLECSNIAEELNGTLEKIEQSVNTLADYALIQAKDTDRLINDTEYFEQYVSQIENIAVNSATHTDGAVAAYFQFNPEYWGNAKGFLISESPDGKMYNAEVQDLSLYSYDDFSRTGWYYLPVNERKAVWTKPYLNEDMNVYMISYVVPIYSNDILVGVIGMDIDFSVFTNFVADKKIYKSGYAFLVSEDYNTLYHYTAPEGVPLGTAGNNLAEIANEFGNGTSGSSLVEYSNGKETREMAFRSLRNNIYVAITAPEKEINSIRNRLIVIIIAAGVVCLAAALVMTIVIARKMTKPLLELNDAAQRIAEGDFNVTITSKSKDEIGTLAESFRRTVEHLRHYIGYINGLAYLDNMTGVKNKTSYAEAVRSLERRIKDGKSDFGIAVFDINNLKQVNDNYGHEAGDELIISSCHVICITFSHSPVYRIGGDEFVAILHNENLKNVQELMYELSENAEKANNEDEKLYKISIAAGYAVFDPERDKSFSDVFNRADTDMYRNKAETKKKSS